MTRPGAGPQPGPVAVPMPEPSDLASLTDQWAAVTVLPPWAPPGVRYWHRRTADGYLTLMVMQVQGLYQVQLQHMVVGAVGLVELQGLAGRPPSIAELADALARFTKPGTLFLMFLVAPRKPDLPWPNPVAIGCSAVGTAGIGAALAQLPHN